LTDAAATGGFKKRQDIRLHVLTFPRGQVHCDGEGGLVIEMSGLGLLHQRRGESGLPKEDKAKQKNRCPN